MKYHLLWIFLIIVCCFAKQGVAGEGEAPQPFRTIRFTWAPPGGPASVYRMDEPEDQHRIVIFPGVKKGAKVPVVVAFHGQPGKGRDPRQYPFPGRM